MAATNGGKNASLLAMPKMPPHTGAGPVAIRPARIVNRYPQSKPAVSGTQHWSRAHDTASALNRE
jgi:hypothetical protein